VDKQREIECRTRAFEIYRQQYCARRLTVKAGATTP
jgi:hypothetical protein